MGKLERIQIKEVTTLQWHLVNSLNERKLPLAPVTSLNLKIKDINNQPHNFFVLNTNSATCYLPVYSIFTVVPG